MRGIIIIASVFHGPQLERIHVENWICDKRIIFHLLLSGRTTVESKFCFISLEFIFIYHAS